MSEKKSYAATNDFLLTINNGEETINVFPGDVISFDGLNVECKGKTGVARSFSAIAREGEWVRPISAENAGILEEQAAIVAEKKVAEMSSPASAIRSKNATGDKIIENSDVSNDPYAPINEKITSNDYKNLKKLVENYEKQSYSGDTKIINSDDEIVAEVSDVAKIATTTNKSGIEIEEKKESKQAVISEEEKIVKKTNYTEKDQSQNNKTKKLMVDKDSEGVVVKKASIPAINKNEVNEKTKVENSDVYEEEMPVKETSYDEEKHIDIGSSTKAQTIGKKSSTEDTSVKAKKASTQEFMDQDAVVVGKVKKSNSSKSEAGINSKVSVGKNEGKDGKAVFSNSSNGIEMNDVEISSTEPGVVEISSNEDDLGINIEDLLND